ncbi:MAG: hypothetical protein HY866_02300 [Chloroflexi bacterium]|nr:hypothetical protein [Chloroflexota bacterium]
MYAKNELMFPAYAIPHLRDARGPEWRKLVDRVAALPETHEEVLAFMLMMVRINGCMPCETDSYRAMRGCTACTLQTLRRFKDSDDDLVSLYHEALTDVQSYMSRAQLIPLRVSVVAENG